jgi:hypothetical protein
MWVPYERDSLASLPPEPQQLGIEKKEGDVWGRREGCAKDDGKNQ